MAEIAALSNLAGVICCGLRLSISLYDFATALGTAGREIKTLGTDITLFCSVLKQVQSSLGEAKSYRISTDAIQTTQDILDQSSGIFDELLSIFAKLQGDEKLPVDFLTRVRWTFKRAKVLLLRENLQSCTAMLHLMLTTMSFAQRIANKGTAFDDDSEDETERALTHSLCLAQQTTKERLEELEKECLAEESYRSTSALTVLASEQEHYKCFSPEENVDDSNFDSAAFGAITHTVTVDSGVIASRTTSLLLGTILEQQKSIKKNNRLTWSSISSQQQSVLQSDRLLRNWTNQRDPLAWDEEGSDEESLLPSDSISRYHGRSHSGSITQNLSTFLESATSTSVSDFGSTYLVPGGTPSTEEWPDLTTTRSADDAAHRSRQKVAKLTGVDYTAITADWMWRINEQTGTTALIQLPPLQPLEGNEPPKVRKKPKQLRWVNNRTSLSETCDINKEIQARMRSNGLLL